MLEKRQSSFIIEEVEDGHNFGLEASTGENLMFVLSLLGGEKYKNLQINCINRLLTALSIPLKLFFTRMSQQSAPKVALFSKTLLCLYKYPLQFFSLYVSYLWYQ